MAIGPRGRKRSLAKKISSFNMYMDQVYQIRTIMEATGAVKDAPVIRELLDEALIARRRKSTGTYDSEPAVGQEIRETLHTIQSLLLKLISREELIFRPERRVKSVKRGVDRSAIWSRNRRRRSREANSVEPM